jgi:hypothetical protein
MNRFSFVGLYKMGALQKLHVTFAYYDYYAVPELERWCLGNGPAPRRMRSLMRDLVAAVPQMVGRISWRKGDQEAQKAISDRVWQWPGWSVVEGDVQERLAAESATSRGGPTHPMPTNT